MSRCGTAIVCALSLWTIAVRDAHAQERKGSVYAIVGAGIAHQSEVEDQTKPPAISPGGTTVGWMLAAGIFTGRNVSLEVEVAATGTMQARESARYNMTLAEDRRDTFVGGTVRYHLRRAIHLEPVAGFTFIVHSATSQVEIRSFLPPVTVTIEPRDTLDLPTGFGATAGIDARLGGPHFAFVPTSRIRYRLSGDDWPISGWYGDSFQRFTLTIGVAARVDF